MDTPTLKDKYIGLKVCIISMCFCYTFLDICQFQWYVLTISHDMKWLFEGCFVFLFKLHQW